MDVISLLLFLALLILAFTRKTNMGVLAFGAALILGRIVGLTDKEVVKTLSSSLFVTLTGITLCSRRSTIPARWSLFPTSWFR